MRSGFAVFALLLALAPAAMAGGIHARIEGPGPDGRTYTVRTYDLAPTDQLEPWALAEGVVDQHRKSVLLRLTPTGEHGVYHIERTWPAEGTWMIRLSLGHPPAPATVATLRADGTVAKNRWYRNSDGTRECHQALMRLIPKELRDREEC